MTTWRIHDAIWRRSNTQHQLKKRVRVTYFISPYNRPKGTWSGIHNKKDYCAHLFSQITPGWPLLHLRFCFRRSTCIEMIVTFWEKFIIHCHVLKTHVKLEFKRDWMLILQRQETIQEVENYYVCCSAGDGNTPGIGQPVTQNSSRCSQHCEKYQSSQLAPWKQQRSLWATERTCWISRTSGICNLPVRTALAYISCINFSNVRVTYLITRSVCYMHMLKLSLYCYWIWSLRISGYNW